MACVNPCKAEAHEARLEPADQLNNALAVTYRVAVFYELPPRCSELFKFARTTTVSRGGGAGELLAEGALRTSLQRETVSTSSSGALPSRPRQHRCGSPTT